MQSTTTSNEACTCYDSQKNLISNFKPRQGIPVGLPCICDEAAPSKPNLENYESLGQPIVRMQKGNI